MKNSKATGRDSFPSEFYKSFSSLLIKHMVDICNLVLFQGVTPATWSEARIVVIPKSGKNPQKVESYRPVSLLNHDAKLFASTLQGNSIRLFWSMFTQTRQGSFPCVS